MIASGDEHQLTVGEAAEQRGGGEDDEPGQERSLAPEQVTQAASGQEQRCEREDVAVDDPLQCLLPEPELAVDRGQRDVDDRVVDGGDEDRERNGDQRQALPC